MWMCAFSYAYSPPCDKDGGYTIQSAVSDNPTLHANITALCLIERELLPIEVLHSGNRNFRPFWPLWPWPWLDDHHIWTWPVFPGDISHVWKWTSYVKAFKSYHLTDIQTHRHDQNYIPRCFARSSLLINAQYPYACISTNNNNFIFGTVSQQSLLRDSTWV